MSENTIVTCPVCHNEDTVIPLWDTNHIIRCSQCTLAYLRQMPTVDELKALYQEDFFKGDASYADYVAEKQSLQRNFMHRIKVLQQFSSKGSLFDAGCAHGFFMELATKYWDHVSGMDISDVAIEYARNELNLDAHVGDFESIDLQESSIDVITMWDTIEHLYDPVLAIEKSHEYLKTGGYLTITTGDIETLVPKIQKRNWRLIHPTHLYYFSRNSITHLLESKGFEVVHFSYIANWRSLQQISRVITFGQTEQSWRNTLLKYVNYLPFLDMQIPINLYDIMYVVARKK